MRRRRGNWEQRAKQGLEGSEKRRKKGGGRGEGMEGEVSQGKWKAGGGEGEASFHLTLPPLQ